MRGERRVASGVPMRARCSSTRGSLGPSSCSSLKRDFFPIYQGWGEFHGGTCIEAIRRVAMRRVKGMGEVLPKMLGGIHHVGLEVVVICHVDGHGNIPLWSAPHLNLKPLVRTHPQAVRTLRQGGM